MTDQAQTVSVSATPPAAAAAEVNAPRPKKPRTPAQLEALAKGREAKRQKARSTAVVKDDDSAKELVRRVRESDPESRVTTRSKRKRSFFDSELTDDAGYGTTALKVAGVAAIAGLAFLGSKGGWLRGFPVATPPTGAPLPGAPAAGAPAPFGTMPAANTTLPGGPLGAPVGISLSGGQYIP